MPVPTQPSDSQLLEWLFETRHHVSKVEGDYYLTLEREDVTVRGATPRGAVIRAMRLLEAHEEARRIISNAMKEVGKWTL